jgi:SnoaL-like domain
MAIKTETLLVRNLTEVFGESDATKRKAAIAELWSEEGVFVDAFGRFVGRDAINESVSHLHQKFPGFVFTPIGAPEAFHDIGRLSWGHGPAGQEPKVKGVDVVSVRNGRIASLYTFIDAMPE